MIRDRNEKVQGRRKSPGDGEAREMFGGIPGQEKSTRNPLGEEASSCARRGEYLQGDQCQKAGCLLEEGG